MKSHEIEQGHVCKEVAEGRFLSRMQLAVCVVVLIAPLQSMAASWSPDGRQLAYSFIGGPENIYLVNADGTGVVELVLREQRDFRPEWSPDGSHLVFTTVVDGVHVMMRVDRDGSNLRPISQVGAAAGDPDYSQDGRYLLYFTDEPLPRDMFMRDTRTGEVTALTNTPDGNGFAVLDPHFSLDDNYITFTRTDFAEKGVGMPAVVRVSLKNGDEVPIARGLYLSQTATLRQQVTDR